MNMAAPELHPVSVVSPWHQLGIEFIGPLTPATTHCSRYVLTISDYFTKNVQAFAMESKHAPGVANALFKVCVILRKCAHGVANALFKVCVILCKCAHVRTNVTTCKCKCTLGSVLMSPSLSLFP